MSEETDHMLELERLDRCSPGWDAKSRASTVIHFLTRNEPVSRALLVAVYGEPTVAKAEAETFRREPCRRDECGHSRWRHTDRSVVVGETDRTACSVDDCRAVCSRFIEKDAPRCSRCGDWDPACVCYAR